MFKVKNMDETWDLEDGRKTKILFGLNKPYPPKASIKKNSCIILLFNEQVSPD